MNRDAYSTKLQQLQDFIKSDAGDPWSRFRNYQEEQQRRLARMEAGMNSDDLNQIPWLVEIIRPSYADDLRYQILLGAIQRVALGEVVLRIAEFDGEPDTITVADALDRLNRSEFHLDPFSGESLKTIERNGRRTVYSIGADGRDDQAISLSMEHLPGDLFFAPERS